MKKIFFALLFLTACTGAEYNTRTPDPTFEQNKPANVPLAARATVIATINVRLNGVLVDPQVLTYTFSPVFPGNSGRPQRMSEGTYQLRAEVPVDQTSVLALSATTNDTTYRQDGTIDRLGKTTTATLRLNVPYGTQVDLGVQFLDLR